MCPSSLTLAKSNQTTTPPPDTIRSCAPLPPDDHQKVAPVAQLERRVDRLEFELRKSLHELRHSAGRPAGHHDEHLHALESRWSALGERLELVEKFITITTTKVSNGVVGCVWAGSWPRTHANSGKVSFLLRPVPFAWLARRVPLVSDGAPVAPVAATGGAPGPL